MKDNMKSQTDKKTARFKIFGMNEYHESFPHAYAVLGSKLYCSTLFNNILYEVDLDSDSVEEYYFPVDCNRIPCYRFAIPYKNSILFVPEYEGFFSCFQAGKIFTIPAKGNYASGYMKNEDLYLLDRKRFCIDVFNLTHFIYTGRILLPRMNNVDYYIDIIGDNYNLYVTSGIDCQILQINMMSKKIEKIKTDALICYGILENGEIIYTSTGKDLDGIFSFDVHTGKSSRLAFIEYDSRKPIRYYRFWNTKKIGGYIYFLPHEESKIIRYDILEKKVEYLTPFDDNYRTLRPDKSNAIYGIVQFRNNVLIMPYFGNLIYVLDYKGNVINAYRFPFSAHQRRCMLEKMIEYSNILWETTGLLKEYIDCVAYRDTSRGTNRNLGFAGSRIYKEIKGDVG